MIRRTLTPTTKALVLLAVMYLTAGALAWAVNAAATWDHVRPAQHGPVRPAPDPTTR